eukprot:g11879.t1
MRKVSSQIFSRKNFNTKMQEVFVSKSEQLRKFLQKQGDKPVDIQACFFNFTFDSIMDIFFGEQSNTAEGVPNVYGKAFDRANSNRLVRKAQEDPNLAETWTRAIFIGVGSPRFEDDVVPGGFTIPKWSTIAYVPYAMGRDATRYPEPLAFRPERWIPFTPPAHHEFPVFQAGPRICLGMDMALFEAKTITVELLRFLRFEMVEGQKVQANGERQQPDVPSCPRPKLRTNAHHPASALNGKDIKSNGKDEFMVRTKLGSTAARLG